MACNILGRFVFDNATPEAVEANEYIPVSSITTTGRCLSCDGTTITIKRAGDYQVNANFTLVGTAAGNVEIQMNRNGNAVPGMHGVASFAAAGDYATLSCSTIITVPSAVPQAAINFEVDEAASVRIANITVTRA